MLKLKALSRAAEAAEFSASGEALLPMSGMEVGANKDSRNPRLKSEGLKAMQIKFSIINDCKLKAEVLRDFGFFIMGTVRASVV